MPNVFTEFLNKDDDDDDDDDDVDGVRRNCIGYSISRRFVAIGSL